MSDSHTVIAAQQERDGAIARIRSEALAYVASASDSPTLNELVSHFEESDVRYTSRAIAALLTEGVLRLDGRRTLHFSAPPESR